MEINKYYIGDNSKLIEDLASNSIDFILTSPPYGKLRDYKSSEASDYDFTKLAKEMFRVLKDGGILAWNEGDSKLKGSMTLIPYEHVIEFKKLGFRVHQVLIYEKNGSPPHKNLYVDAIEYIYILSKGVPKTVNLIQDKPNKWAGTSSYGESTRRTKDGKLTTKGRSVIAKYGRRTSIWRYTAGKFNGTKDDIAFLNPATMPDGLAIDLLESYSKKGDLILDPFAGSGTTLKMAKLMQRNYIGFELSQDYGNIIAERLKSDALLQKDQLKVDKYLAEADD